VRCGAEADGDPSEPMINEVCEDGLDILANISTTAPPYDPTLVDWRSAKKAFEYIANKEKRFCNFAIRSHFHDAGSLGDVPDNPFVRLSLRAGFYL
jgi:hypothetical protein